MLVEHTFVTTWEWKDVIQRLVGPMELMGFRWEVQCTSCGYDVRGSLQEGRTLCSECGKPAPLVFTAGRKSPGMAKGVSDCPQRIQIDFDRGRVMIGAAITPRGKSKGEHGMVVSDLVRGIEYFLLHDVSAEEAFGRWRENAFRYDEVVQRKRRQGCTIALVIFFAVIALIILIAVLASSGSRRRYGLDLPPVQPPAIGFTETSWNGDYPCYPISSS